MIRMKALAAFQSGEIGADKAGDEFDCDTELRASYLERAGVAVKIAHPPKNKMAKAPRNKGKKNAG